MACRCRRILFFFQSSIFEQSENKTERHPFSRSCQSDLQSVIADEDAAACNCLPVSAGALVFADNPCNGVAGHALFSGTSMTFALMTNWGSGTAVLLLFPYLLLIVMHGFGPIRTCLHRAISKSLTK